MLGPSFQSDNSSCPTRRAGQSYSMGQSPQLHSFDDWFMGQNFEILGHPVSESNYVD